MGTNCLSETLIAARAKTFRCCSDGSGSAIFRLSCPAPLLQKSLSDNNLTLPHTHPAQMQQPEFVFLFPRGWRSVGAVSGQDVLDWPYRTIALRKKTS